jgi:hypothetical protein
MAQQHLFFAGQRRLATETISDPAKFGLVRPFREPELHMVLEDGGRKVVMVVVMMMMRC